MKSVSQKTGSKKVWEWKAEYGNHVMLLWRIPFRMLSVLRLLDRQLYARSRLAHRLSAQRLLTWWLLAVGSVAVGSDVAS